MHRLVLEDRVHGRGAVEQRMAWHVEIGMRQRVDDEAVRRLDERAHARRDRAT